MLIDTLRITGLIIALAAAIKATEFLIGRGVRGFRGIKRFGTIFGALYDIGEQFKPNGRPLSDQLECIDNTLSTMHNKLDVITEGCPLLQPPHVHAEEEQSGDP